MGLFGKIRDMLTYEDDNDDVEPVKKEVSTVSIPAPIEEKKKIDFEVEEREEIPKKEEKTPFMIFTDSDFNDFAKEKKEEKKPYQKKEEVRKFKPTPIISPVYGIIKDDTKKEEVSTLSRTQDFTVDDIRKKAYGTLEDDVETNLFSTKELVLENNNRNDIFDEVNEAIKERDKVNDDSDKAINENDLFNLIDSMYERKDD